MSSIYPRVRSMALIAIVTTALAPTPGSAADFFAQGSTAIRVTDTAGNALPPSALETTFIEATPGGTATGPSITFAYSEPTTSAGAVDGFDASVGVAGTSTGGTSQADADWLGGVLVRSSSNRLVEIRLAYMAVAAGSVAVPEGVANAGATIDMVVGTVFPGCLPSGTSVVRNVDPGCFDLVVRIPLDDQEGAAQPNFLHHSAVGPDGYASLVMSVPNGTGSPGTLTGGAERKATIGLGGGLPVFVGVAATGLGDARLTGHPHCFGQPATIIGTEFDDDPIRGTIGPDVIVGLGGNDKISANEGDDLVCGGEGDDTLVGHRDNDKIAGGPGNDKIDGFYGDDYITGGAGDDFIMGCSGIDVIYGDEGDDTLRGERGDDFIVGGTGNDDIKGAAGDDIVIAGEDVTIDVLALAGSSFVVFQTALEGDNDIANGDRNNDTVHGGPGNDLLKGGKGDDNIDGGAGYDEIKGGGGTDFCVDLDGFSAMDECE